MYLSLWAILSNHTTSTYQQIGVKRTILTIQVPVLNITPRDSFSDPQPLYYKVGLTQVCVGICMPVHIRI